MTPQEAIDRINLLIGTEKLFIKISTMGEISHSQNIEALEMAKQAVEKQIAKEPIATSDDVYDFGNCPHCNKKFDTELVCEYEITHCPWCGQALDWWKLK